MAKILFLVPYPLKQSPSQRFRFEQYFEILKANNHKLRTQSFLNSHNWQVFFKPGKTFVKAWLLLSGFLRRFLILFSSLRYDFVFVHREITPAGPPVFEWILVKILKRKIIYDFDDAIWLTDRKDENWLLRVVKWRSKVRTICKWSYKVSCGNTYLCDYVMQWNNNVIYNPTTIDTENVHNPKLHIKAKHNSNLIIGWTGSHSTLKYLESIENVLLELKGKYPFIEYFIIAEKEPAFKKLKATFRPWSVATEISDLYQFDVGLMPLPDDEWSKGKCGFKALQYMAMQIPTIASPVGVNQSIIVNGENSFLAETEGEWYSALEMLISNSWQRENMGKQGRETVLNHYSVLSNTKNFLSLFA